MLLEVLMQYSCILFLINCRLERRFRAIQIVIIKNFVVVSSVSIKRVDCTLLLGALRARATIFDLITTQSPIGTQTSNFLVFRLQPFTFLCFSIKAYVVGTDLNCLSKLKFLPRMLSVI